MIYHVGITRHPSDPLYHIAVYKTHHDFMIVNPEFREARNAEELMDTLFKIYDWQPEEWDGDPGIDVGKAAEDLTRVYEEQGEEEFYRRLGIGVAPGEEK